MTEPNKPGRRRAEPRRAGLTRARILAVAAAAVVVVVLVVLVRAVVSGDDEAPAARETGPGSSSAKYANTWTTADGSTYAIKVETLTDLVGVGSPDTCIAAPVQGLTTNLHFRVTITNKGKQPAVVPRVLFGSNLSTGGTVMKGVPSFTASNKDLQVIPLAQARTCADGAKLEPQGRDEIPAGASEVFTGTLGPTEVPVPPGVTVLVRYFEGADEKPTDLRARFGRF